MMYLITVVTSIYDKRVFPDIRITCNGTITNWIVGLPPHMSGASAVRYIHLQLKRSTYLINMDADYADLISTNVYNFTMSNETVQYGDQLVIDGTSNPIYCLESNGPQNYWIDSNSNLPNTNCYPLISVIISKCPLMFMLYVYIFSEPTTTDNTIPIDISSSSNENIPMTPTTHTTAILTLDSNIKKSTTLTPTVHDNTAYTQNTISEYII